MLPLTVGAMMTPPRLIVRADELPPPQPKKNPTPMATDRTTIVNMRVNFAIAHLYASLYWPEYVNVVTGTSVEGLA